MQWPSGAARGPRVVVPYAFCQVNPGMQSDEHLAVRAAIAEASERATKARATITEYQSDEAAARRGARGSLAIAIVAAVGITIVVATINLESSGCPFGPYLVVAGGWR